MSGRRLFVTIEGIDGTGKSTQANRLAESLKAEGHATLLTREPGGSPGAEEIRALLVEGEPGRWSPETEILLFTAARRDHVERLIEPALTEGKIVICDRYVDSTRAYQGAESPERRAMVDRLHDLAIGLDPDLTLIFDMEAVAANARILARAGDHGTSREDRFERKGLGFQERLRAEFHAIARAEPDRCRVIDAARPADAVFEAAFDAVRSCLRERNGL